MPATTNTSLGARRGLIALAAGLLGLAAYSLGQAPPAPARYVEPQTCNTCHAEIWKTYRQTAMGRSFSRPDFPLPAGENTFYHPPSESYFAMSRRDGKLYQSRRQLDPSGRPVNVIEKQVDYVMGSGNHALAFLHRTPQGALLELPLAWYAENGGYWAMNPGYDTPHHEGFRRKITYDCMYCHNGYPKIPAGHEQTFAEPVYQEPLPLGIDCQRCHGPGSDHVQLARNGAKPDTIRNAIVNPARLSPERREEVCIQCHLETTSFPLPNSLQRYGTGPFDYRPGQPLGDYWLFFDHAAGAGRDDKFEFVNAAYRIRRSRCFLQSGGKLLCTSCHNPHDVPRVAAAAAHYDNACRQCHSAAFDRLIAAGKHTGAPGCAACHMPKRRTEDVVHAVATDHLIQRRPPAGELLAGMDERHETGDKAYRGEVVLYYPQTLLKTPENELYLALAQVIQKSNLDRGAPRLAAALQRHAPPRAEFYYELAEAWRNSGHTARSIPLYREALRRNPNFSLGLEKLGSALRKSGQPAAAVETLRRAAAIAPGQASIWHELGLAYSARDNRTEALAALEKAVALDPDAPEFHSNLAIVQATSGDPNRAAASFREAIRLQPDYADAHGNLANLLSAAGNFDEARRHFETALRYTPNDAATRYNFAMALGRARQYDEAQRQLEAAVRADPRHTNARQSLAELLLAKGQPQAALPHYRELVRLQPDSGPALLGLGSALAMTGDGNGALPYLRKAAASADPEARQQAAEILRQLENRR